ncbi:MAG: hypothetical protein IJ311_06160, partial [Elusimicrobiaceae bacterium]|nr:hypothetical protein [Elusimicrobiaceae bacterium]
IKNSKPAFNPFSKRVSSKIGNNGKPKKTLFERTRRDAPFFVAAAAALLMLPFLYKYSGSVEDGAIITPGTDSVFEPDRSGFDPSFEDPSAQIAQLSVRDPLSLIKGWGEPEPAPSLGSYDNRDGLDDTYTPPARSYHNENSYRQQAPAASRAAFQRQAPSPTKVNKLGSAGMNLRGGGGGFGRFGGANLKTAAKASSAPTPKQGVKPVSLQPLRAAGNPSRSYFGQGAAAQARASRDAMGKANALQALNDAMYDPLKANQAPLGGLGGGDFVGGAGAGKWDPHSEYKGITPWWWDMMKQQEMEKWKWKYFFWKKGLFEPLLKGIVDGFIVPYLNGALSCLFSATDDVSMGNMGRISTAMAGSPAGCEMLGEGGAVTLEQFCNPEGSFKNSEGWALVCGEEISDKASAYETWCKGDKDLGFDTHGDWSDSSPAMNEMSYWGRVRHCFNNAYTGEVKELLDRNKHTVKEQSDCKQIANHSFILKPHSYFSENGYDKYYHVVIVKNQEFNGEPLCKPKTELRSAVAGFNAGNTAAKTKDGGHGSARIVNADNNIKYAAKDNSTTDQTKVRGGAQALASDVEISDSKFANECVIYWAEGREFKYKNYETLVDGAQRATVIDETNKNLHGWGNHKGSVYTSEAKGDSTKGTEWDKLKIDGLAVQPLAIEGYVMKKDPFPGDKKMGKILPMMYKDFIAEYVAGQDGGQVLCEWTKFNITAKNIVSLGDIHAVLAYDPEVYGNKPEERINVTVEIVGENLTPIQVTATRTHSTEEDNGAGASVFRAPLSKEQLDALTAYFATATAEAPKEIVAKWLAKEGDQESKDTADYSSTTPSVEMTVPTGITPINPETLVDKTKPYLLLSREVSAIPTDLEGHRILDVQSGSFKVKKADAAKLFLNLSDDSKARLDQATLDTRSSNAAATFMTQVVNDFNALEEDKRKGTFLFDYYNEGIFLAEFVDAMYIAKNVLQKNEVPRAAVCTMMRGVALSSEDTKGKAAGLEMTNTFGAAAIYIGLDSAYYPNQYVKKDGNMVVDPRFSSDPYHWGNYVSCTNGGIYHTPKQQIETVKVKGKYPLASMVSDIISPIAVENLNCSPTTIVDDNRKKYVETYNDILFANEGKCDSLTGNMPIQDALDYVSKVAELGLDYKPQAVLSSGEGSDGGRMTGNSQRRASSRI